MITPALLSHISRADLQQLGTLAAVLREIARERIRPRAALLVIGQEIQDRIKRAQEMALASHDEELPF